MEASGSVAYASAYTTDLAQKAKMQLDGILPESKAKKLLLSMADFLVARSN